MAGSVAGVVGLANGVAILGIGTDGRFMNDPAQSWTTWLNVV